MFRRSAARALTPALAAAALLASSPGVAGDKTPLSGLPTMPAPRDRTEAPQEYKNGVAGVTVKEHASAARIYLEVVAATSRGFCIIERDWSFRLGYSTAEVDKPVEVWRLVEDDGKATLERTRLEVAVDAKNAWTRSKTSIELRPMTRSNDVTVWAFRDGPAGDVVLVARGVDRGRELRPLESEGAPSFVSSECGFGAVRLMPSAAKTGTLAQLRGTLPHAPSGRGEPKVTPEFLVDASLAKLSRDPEPVLSVRFRMVE